MLRLLLLAFLFFVCCNWLLSFTSLDEGRNMSAVLHMLQSGDLIKPEYNCKPRFEKPPLLYWSVALLSQLFGLNEFSARLVSGLSAIGVLLLTYRLARELFGKEVAFKSSIILMTFPHLWIEARAVVPEFLNTFFTFAGLYAFLRERFLIGWLFLALAFLTKGPVGVLLAVGVYLIWKRDLRFLNIKGLLIFVLLGFSWYFLMMLSYGYEYFYRFFIYENIMRYTGHRLTHPSPFYYYLVLMLAVSLLYIPLYPRLLRGLSRDMIPLLLWFLFVLAFFSLAKNKLHHYILFAYPPLAIMLARVASERYVRIALSLSLALFVSLIPLLYFYEKSRFVPKAYPVLKASKEPAYFYRAEDSALVYYSGRCIKELSSPEGAKGFVITKEKYAKDFAGCSLLTSGREFDGVYVLLHCKGINF